VFRLDLCELFRQRRGGKLTGTRLPRPKARGMCVWRTASGLEFLDCLSEAMEIEIDGALNGRKPVEVEIGI